MSGVYILMAGPDVIYVGESRNIYGRVWDHRTNGRRFDAAYYIEAPDGERQKLERALIRAFRPEENVRHSTDTKGERLSFQDRWGAVLMQRPEAPEPPPTPVVAPAAPKVLTMKQALLAVGGLAPQFAKAVKAGAVPRIWQGRRFLLLRTDVEQWEASETERLAQALRDAN